LIEDLKGRLVDLAQDVMRGLARVGLLVNPAGANRAMVEGQVASAAHVRGLSMFVEEASEPEALTPAIDRMAKAGAQVVIVQPNGMFINQRSTILKQVLAARLPSVFADRGAPAAGGVMSYGVNENEGSRRAAAFVDKIF